LTHSSLASKQASKQYYHSQVIPSFLFYLFVLTLFFMISPFFTFGQSNCDTPAFTDEDTPECFEGSGKCRLDNFEPFANGQCNTANNDLIVVRAYVHLVRRSDGTGAQSMSMVNQSLNILVDKFSPHGILFSFEGIDFVDNDILYNYNPDSNFTTLVSQNAHPNGLDIYFCGPGIYDNGRGNPPYKSRNACVIGGGTDDYGTPLPLTTLLAHEVGHCFGLLHTFETACDVSGCAFSPLNCNCGDFVYDTNPESGSVCVDSICNYCLPNQTFPNGEPPIDNIMSYYPEFCKTRFTVGQQWRMKWFLTECDSLSRTVSTDPIRITSGLNINYNVDIRECNPGFIVEPGATLTIQQNLKFLDNSKIVVKPTGRLNVEGATLSGCSNHYWQGIEVYGNPAVDQLPFSTICDQGYAKLSGDAVIKKAMYPLLAYDGGLVRAFSTDFLECGEASFYDYSFQNFSTFEDCNFTRSADFGLSFYLTQLYLQKVNGVTVSNCRFETIQPTGVEFNGNGIVGADARFYVVNGTVIDGYYNGITGYSWGTEPWTSFRVQACTLQNNFVGVASWDVDNIVVRDNLFQKIGAHPSSGVKRGLDLWNCSAFVVRDNEFIGYSSGGTRIGPSIGVLAANTGSENNEIKKNVYRDLIVANQAEFVNRGEDAEEGLQYLCNNNTSTAYDFYIWDQGIAQIQGGGNATKNAFSHPNTNATNSTYEDFNNQSINPIDYYHLNVPIETPENGYYLNINPIITTETVNCTDGVIDDDGKLTSSEEQILVQDFNTVKTAYQNQKSTYSALPPDSPYAPDLEKQITRSRDTMHRIANRIIRSELADTTGLDVTKIRTWLRNKDSRESAYRIVETYLWEGDTIAARQVRDSIPLKYELKDAQASNHNSYVQWTELKIELLNDGKDILNLDSSTVLYYQSIADTTIGRTGTQLQGLLNLGYQYNYRLNPKIPGGSQGIMAPPTNGIYNKEQAIFEELIAVPNPAKEFVTFRYALPENAGPAMLYIADINGKTIAQMKLQDRAGSIQWSVSHLQSGIYFYSIRYAGSTFSPRKLALIR
jgi:hypothetical protein